MQAWDSLAIPQPQLRMQMCASQTVFTAFCLSSVFAALACRASAADEPAAPKVSAEWYFWNEITGETQWEDPGDVPYEEEGAVRCDDADVPTPSYTLYRRPRAKQPPAAHQHSRLCATDRST